jgi:hypothetical protein
MNVDAAERRKVEERSPKDLAVGDDDDDLGSERPQMGQSLRRAQRRGLKDGQSKPLGRFFYWRRRDLSAAASRAIGLRHDLGDVEASVDQSLEGRDRELWRPKKDEPH